MESVNVSTKQQRIAALAKQMPQLSFTSLNQYLDVEWLEEAYRRINKRSSPGVSGKTVAEYGENLAENLKSLLERAKSGTYCAPPVKRVYIPKGSNPAEKRPIGMPETEDKVLQRAIVMLLEPIYEQEFLPCSYGFRIGHSAHQALDTIWKQAMKTEGGWVLEVDIRKFFDTLDHTQLRELIKRRVCDGVIMRLIGKWLNAGVMDKGNITYPERGSPQGGLISPMLSNIYLHYVLDQWFMEQIKPRLYGEAALVRFADDFVILFKHQEDAQRVYNVLSKRFSKFGLAIHPEKTKLIEFKPAVTKTKAHAVDRFDFLGFTHYWSLSRKDNWIVKRKTAKDRLRRAIKSIDTWCRENRHRKIREQYKELSAKLRGHFSYFGITGNSRRLGTVWHRVRQCWRYWLNRRSRKDSMLWERFLALEKYLPLPRPIAIHSVCAANQ